MATIGSIAIGFDAETSGLRTGIDAAVASLRELREVADSLNKKLSSLSSLKFSISVDSSSLAGASKAVEDLKTEVESSKKEFEEAGKGAEVLEKAVEATGEAAEKAADQVKGIAKDVKDALSASGDEAVKGTESFIGMKDSLVSLRDTAKGTLGAVEVASNSAGRAAAGLSQAIENVSSGKGLKDAADSSIVAAGRITVAYAAVNTLFREALPRSLEAATGAVKGFADNIGGLGVVTAAFRGDSAAATAVLGALGGALAGAGAAVATYAGILAIARAASAGLSEEAQAYVNQGAAYVGAIAAGGVAAKAGSLAIQGIKTSISESKTASEAASAAFTNFGAAVREGVGPAITLVSALNLINENLSLTSAASEKSASGFAGVAAKLIVTRAAFGAVTGAVSAYVGGTALMTGAITGATAALTTMVSLFPVYAGLAVAAAVVTGRVEQKLRELAAGIQQVSDLSSRFGQPTQEIEKLQIAARNAGVAFGALVRGQQNFASNLEKVKIGNLGSKEAREANTAFNDLGLSADRLRNLSPESAMQEVAKAISAVGDSTKKTQLAMDIFGRTGPALLPLLKNLEAINADMARLGGATSDVDVQRFSDLGDSFNRLRQASDSLAQNLLLPFTRMQEAFNNAMADISGGLSPIFNVIGSAIADATVPLAVMVEMFGRVFNVAARLVGVVARLVATFLPLKTVAAIATGIRDGFMSAIKPIEQLIGFLEALANRISSALGGSVGVFNLLGQAIGFVVGGIVQLITYVTIGAAVWGLYSAAVAIASGFSIAATVSFIAMWIAALGPFAVVIGGLAAIGAGIAALTFGVSKLVDWFFSWGESASAIDGATASVDELAEAVEAAESSTLKKSAEEGMTAIGEAASKAVDKVGAALGFSEEQIESFKEAANEAAVAVGEAASSVFSAVGEAASGAVDRVGETLGFSEEQVESFKNSVSGAVSAAAALVGIDLGSGGEAESDRFTKIRESIAGARDAMEDFSIRAARLGTAGAEAVTKSTEEFNKLQRELGKGKISLEQFEKGTAELQESLEKTLDAIEKGSPEETLKKNLEVFKQMDDSAKAVAKSVRDIGAGVQIGDKFFPRSDEVKNRAKQYSDEYSNALEGIKKKLASGGFQKELDDQRAELERAKKAGEIDEKAFKKRKLELDTTSAQEQASIAAEEVQRELDRQQATLKIELDFADNIRKRLEDAFLSPVEKFQKELDKIKSNIDLTNEEKALAEQDLRKTAREQIIGKSPVESFDERQRDLKQAADSGLITDDEMRNKMLQNLDNLAEALGIPVDPANKMEVAVSQLDDALKQGKISVEQHAEGLKEARKSFLESLGIKARAEEADSDRMAALEKQLKAGNITKEEFERGRQAAENDIIGQSAADRIAEQRSRIEAGIERGTVDEGRGAAALRSLDSERRRAAGLDDTAAQKLELGIDRVNDAFGVAGKTIEEIQATLSPEAFEEYQKAIEKSAKAVENSIVGQSVADRISEKREKIQEGIDSGAVSKERGEAALRSLDSERRRAAGVQDTPAQSLQAGVDKINDAFGVAGKSIEEIQATLSPSEFAEYQKALENNTKSIRASLGVEESINSRLQESRERLNQAVEAGIVSQEEADAAFKKQRDSILSSLGIDKSPIEAFEEATERLADAAGEGAITQEELARGAAKARDALLNSLGIPASPIEKLAERTKNLDDALAKGLITQEQYRKGLEEARKALPGSDPENPLQKFNEDLQTINDAVARGLIDEDDAENRRQNIRAELQENLKPALDSVSPDRRLAQSSDARSKGGVDTFFRILQGRDNPSLKAQLDIARNTKILADAEQQPEAQAVIAQLSAR